MKKTLLLILLLAAQYGYSQCIFTYSSVINVSCFGLCDGSATVIATGGTPPYSYQWSTIPPQLTQTVTGLCAGTYTCSVSDASGPCVPQNPPPTINEPPQLIVSATAGTSPCDTCGTLTVTVIGGTPGYTYLWYNSTNTQSAIFCGGGSYWIIVSDANGCTTSDTVTVTVSPPLTLGHVTTNATCDTCCDGYYVPAMGGGTLPYNFSTSCTPFSNLCPGTNYCCITDANGCTACDTIIISYPISVHENISSAGIKISPNPFSTSATIIFNSELIIKNPELKMYDVMGREVKQLAITNPQSEIDRDSLQNGIYFYKVTSEKGMIAAGKIMVE